MENKKTLYAVALVIYNDDRSKFLIAHRPHDAESMPDVWGLIAGYVGEEETFEEAGVRAGWQKLGVILSPRSFVGRDNIQRDGYVLHMEEYEAKILRGEPAVPQNVKGVTQYNELKYGTSEDILDAARKGSLCSRIYLDSIGKK